MMAPKGVACIPSLPAPLSTYLSTSPTSYTHTHSHSIAKLNVTDSHNCSLVTDQSGITALLTASRPSLSRTHTNTHPHKHRQWAFTGPLSDSLTVNESCDVQSAQIKPGRTVNHLTIDGLLQRCQNVNAALDWLHFSTSPSWYSEQNTSLLSSPQTPCFMHIKGFNRLIPQSLLSYICD